MPIRQRTPWTSMRVQFRELLQRAIRGEGTASAAERLEAILGARGELLGMHGNLVRQVDVTTAATLLQDPDRIAAYAETLAAEAAVRSGSGELEHAVTLRDRALALALQAQARFGAPDADIERLIGELHGMSGDTPDASSA